MKKIIRLSLLIFLVSCTGAYTFPASITDEAIVKNHQVLYSTQSGRWNNDGITNDDIVFTKHISSGSGSYSEYISSKQDIYLGTTFEFLYNGKLIGYDQHNLKFYEIKHQKDKFIAVSLKTEQVKKIFKGLQIVKTSEAINGVLTIKKLPFEQKSFLLLNDADTGYYHYSFEDFTNLSQAPIKSIITVDCARDIIFSHFGSREQMNPILTLKIENKF